MSTHLLIRLLELSVPHWTQNRREFWNVLQISCLAGIINSGPHRKASISGPHKNFVIVEKEKSQEISNKKKGGKVFFSFSPFQEKDPSSKEGKKIFT